jgi:hypothetical protein
VGRDIISSLPAECGPDSKTTISVELPPTGSWRCLPLVLDVVQREQETGPRSQGVVKGMDMAAYKVIQWGTGGVGVWALRQVLDAPDLELVGLKCATDAKAGVDAGIIAGRDPVGIAATKNADELVALDADVVLFMPRVSLKDPTIPGSPAAAWVDEVTPLLASGKNVVSSIATGIHYRHLADGDSLVAQLNAACAEGNASIFFTGVDPGFVSDALAIALTSSVTDIAQVRTWEFIDYANYPVPEVMNELGFGMRPDQTRCDDGRIAARVLGLRALAYRREPRRRTRRNSPRHRFLPISPDIHRPRWNAGRSGNDRRDTVDDDRGC